MRLLVSLLVVLAFPASAQVYKWTDAEGNVHFGTQPPPGDQEEVHIRESKPGAFGSERQNTTFGVEERREEIEPTNRRKSFSSSMETSPTSTSDSSRSCKYAMSVLQSYENKLDRLLQQGYKQYERQRAENNVAEWEDQVSIYCQ
jgi:hypothetical protein